jgi:hypothetical protein
LVDILRNMAAYDCGSVLGRTWYISDLEANMEGFSYTSEYTLGRLFGKYSLTLGPTWAIVTGEALLMRSALTSQFEAFYCARLINDAEMPIVPAALQLDPGPDCSQSTNVDLEIRCDECGPISVVSADVQLVEGLRGRFANTEILGFDTWPNDQEGHRSE